MNSLKSPQISNCGMSITKLASDLPEANNDMTNRSFSSVGTTVIPVEISRALKDRAPKNWLSGVSRYGRRMPNVR